MDPPEAIARFQDVTGVSDREQCVQILEATNWDLDSAVQMFLAMSAGDHQDDGNERGLAAALAPNHGTHIPRGLYADSRGGVRGAQALSLGSGGNPSNPRRVWRLVLLPLSIVQGSFGLLMAACGFGRWAAGRMVNYSVNMLTSMASWAASQGSHHLQNQQQQHASRRRLLGGGSSVPESSLFLKRFEDEYGHVHPGFVESSFMDALRRAGEQFKFLFVYIHSAEHANTPEFCQTTLCSEAVIQFVDNNFVAWGGDVRGSEGFQMSNVLKASTFPFCCIVTASSGQRVALLQVVEGPKRPDDLISSLQRVLDDHGPMLVAQRMEEDERALSRRLREEQDAAFQAALLADQEREKKRKEEEEELKRKAADEERKRKEEEEAVLQAQRAAAEREALLERRRIEKAAALVPEPEKGPTVTQVLIRFPNGERKERRFHSSSPVQAIYDYVDSLGSVAAVHYTLISNFPRKEYGPDKMSVSLESVGLHPNASLFVQENDP